MEPVDSFPINCCNTACGMTKISYLDIHKHRRETSYYYNVTIVILVYLGQDEGGSLDARPGRVHESSG